MDIEQLCEKLKIPFNPFKMEEPKSTEVHNLALQAAKLLAEESGYDAGLIAPGYVEGFLGKKAVCPWQGNNERAKAWWFGYNKGAERQERLKKEAYTKPEHRDL